MKNRMFRIGKAIDSGFGLAQESIASMSAAVAGQEWFKNLNSHKDDITKAMDAGWLDVIKKKVSSIDPETGLPMSASNHRILGEGHTISESLSRAFEVGDQQGMSDMESFMAWAKAYMTDLSSEAGVPAFGKLSDDIYAFLREHLKISDDSRRVPHRLRARRKYADPRPRHRRSHPGDRRNDMAEQEDRKGNRHRGRSEGLVDTCPDSGIPRSNAGVHR